MAEPTPGLTVFDAADKILASMQEPEATPAEPSEVEEPTSELSEEVVEEAEVSAESEEPSEEPVEIAEPSDDETKTFLTDLNDWIKDKEHLDEIRIPTKVNGVEREASLSELLANHQIGQAAEERLNTLKAEKAEFEQTKSQQLEHFNAQLTQATELVNLLEKQFMADAESINWNELRETDPAEYSARRQDLVDKQQQLNNAKSTIVQEQQSRVKEQYQELLQRESAALLDSFPSWADEAVAKQEKTDIRNFLLETGFTPQEVDGAVDNAGNILSPGIIDHRAIALARKAMLYDKGEKAVDVAKKKVKKLPKVAKPGRPKSSDEVDVDKQKKLRGRLKKSGSIDDAAALFREKMFGG